MSSDFAASMHQQGLPRCRGIATLGEILRTKEELGTARKEDPVTLNDAITKIAEFTTSSIGPVCTRLCSHEGGGCVLFETLTRDQVIEDPTLERAILAVDTILQLAQEPKPLVIRAVLHNP